MISLKDLRKKIQGIKSTQQITNAMKLMASVKLRRVISEYLSIHLFHDKLEQIILHLKSFMHEHSFSHVLYNKKKEINNIGYIIFTAERGLCGSFNLELIKYAENTISKCKRSQSSIKLIVIGKKGIEFFSKNNYEILSSYCLQSLQEKESLSNSVTKLVIDSYKNNVLDEICLIYSGFISTIERKFEHKVLLPVEEITKGKEAQVKYHKIQFEPSFEEVFNKTINAYIYSSIQRALVETTASEMAARMVAMDSATDRAQEMLENLTLTLNRTRQAIITKELIEIVSTANVLSC